LDFVIARFENGASAFEHVMARSAIVVILSAMRLMKA